MPLTRQLPRLAVMAAILLVFAFAAWINLAR